MLRESHADCSARVARSPCAGEGIELSKTAVANSYSQALATSPARLCDLDQECPCSVTKGIQLVVKNIHLKF